MILSFTKTHQFLLFFFFPVFINALCNPGAVYDSGRNKCYQYYTATVGFQNAESICQSSNGHLLSIHNAIDNNFFVQQSQKNNLNGFIWLGAQSTSHDLTNPKNWKWTDQSSFDYQNYQSGQPAALASTACMIFNSNTGKWLTSGCSNPYQFICSYDLVTTCPSRYAWLKETNSCYRVFIGLVYLNNAWKWTDGSPVDYLNWADGEPNNMDREYWTVLMPDPSTDYYNPNGTQWNNVENYEERAFICKRAAN
uniref:C-type lectin domain-containing protein n=1 Tax=Caenorhabditis tropicalis TaxID=1561998 RepID=A0A1I7TNS0_9PELO